MTSLPITSIADLAKISQDVIKGTKLRRFWWRGVARDWVGGQLVPGVFRTGRNHDHEKEIVSYFMAKAKTRYSNCPPDDDHKAWLFLMQHYGVPTRLLDWTESPLVAAFFAVKDDVASDGFLWALNPYALNGMGVARYLNIFSPDSDNVTLLETFERPFMDELPVGEQAFAVTTKEIDVRMLVQYSTFTLHFGALPLENFDGNVAFLRMFTIPKAAKPSLKNELESIGIRLDSLSPDLENLAKYLSEYSALSPIA